MDTTQIYGRIETMDPDTTYNLIQDAIANKNRDEAVQALEDLADWLKKGGFFPQPIGIQLQHGPHVIVDTVLPPPTKLPQPPHRLPPTQS